MAVTPSTDPPPAEGPGRFRRVIGAVAASIALSVVFVSALVGSVVLHLDVAPERRTVRVVANQLFAGLFAGKVVVGEIDHLDLHGLTIRSADAYDPQGALVIHAEGLRARADVVGIVRSVLAGTGDIAVLVPFVQLDDAEVTLDRDADGRPTIASVFQPRRPPGPAAPGGREPHVTLDHIEIGHVKAHGDLVPNGLEASLSCSTGRFELSPQGLTLDVEPTQIDALALVPTRLVGLATFQLRGAGPDVPMVMDAGIDGRLGDLEVHTTARLAGKHVAARVEVPRATAGAIAALVPGVPPRIPLRAPVSAVIEAEGDLPDVDFDTTLSFDDGGWLSADGTVALEAPLTVDATLALHGLDPRVTLDVPSATPVDGTGHVWVEVGPDLRIDADASTKPLVIAGNVVPAVDAWASFAHGAWRGHADVKEAGAPIAAAFSFDPGGGLGFTVETRVSSLRAVRRLAAPVDGSASVTIAGKLSGDALDARVSGRFEGIRAPGAVALESGVVDGHFTGPLGALQVDASVSGRGLSAHPYAWETVHVHALGPLLAPHFETLLDAGGGESLSASGALDARARVLKGVNVQLTRNKGTIGGQVARIAMTPGGVKIEGLALEGKGVGQLRGGLEVVGKEVVGKLHGENVDLEKVASLAGLPLEVGGLANVDVDLTSSRPGHRKGHIAVELARGAVEQIKGETSVSGVLTATFDGDQMRTDGLLRLVAHAPDGDRAKERSHDGAASGPKPRAPAEPCDGAIAKVRITGGDAELPGPLLDPATWARSSGKVDVAADDWNLRCLRQLPAVQALATALSLRGADVPDVRGKLTTRFTVERAPGARLPTVRDFFAKTLGLKVIGKDWRSLSTDVEVRARMDATTGVTGASVSLLDGGPLATVALGATLDLARLLDHPDQRWASLRVAPVTGRITIPRRAVTAFAELPSFVTDRLPLLTGAQGETIAGDVELGVQLGGTLDAPQIDAHLAGWNLEHATLIEAPSPGAPGKTVRTPVEGAWGLPVDVDVHATYDGHRAQLGDAHVRYKGRDVVSAGGVMALPFADLIAGRVRPAGDFHVDIDRLPLGDIPYFGDRDVRGELSGSLKMGGIGDKPTLHVDLGVPGFKIGPGVDYRVARVALDVAPPVKAGARSAAKLAVELSGGTGGTFITSVENSVVWTNGAVPGLDPDSPATLDLKAKGFRIAAVEPFLGDALSRLDGVLEGGAHLDWIPGQAGADTRLGDVQLKLSDGIVYLPQLGQELHGVTLEVSRDQAGKVLFKGMRAQGTKGLLTGAGSAELRGLLPSRADLAFAIKPEDKLPLTLEGVPIGDASGQIKVTAKAKNWTDWDVTVALDPLHLDLAPALGRSVQADDDNPDIHLSHRLKPVDVPVPPSARRIVLKFDPVHIEVKGKALGTVPLDALLDGSKSAPLRVELGGKQARVSGIVDLTHVSLEVLHKTFLIEHGTVRMNPDNVARSFVNATARYEPAPPDLPVDVEFVGEATPLSADKLKDKLKCRSGDLSQDRCFSSLVVGGPEQSGQSGSQSQTLAMQVLASQFNTQIVGGLSTSLGTNDDGSIRPGLAYRLGQATIEASTYGNGLGGSGSAPSTTAGAAAPKGQHELVTIDWRFWRNWLMRGKIDVGSDQQTYGADVLWQYRY